jgi:hypothetical protein
MTSQMASCDVYRCARLFYFRCLKFESLRSRHEQNFVIIKPLRGRFVLISVVYSGLAFARVLMHIVDPLLIYK